MELNQKALADALAQASAERDRLRAINAELVEVVEEFLRWYVDIGDYSEDFITQACATVAEATDKPRIFASDAERRRYYMTRAEKQH